MEGRRNGVPLAKLKPATKQAGRKASDNEGGMTMSEAMNEPSVGRSNASVMRLYFDANNGRSARDEVLYFNPATSAVRRRFAKADAP